MHIAWISCKFRYLILIISTFQLLGCATPIVPPPSMTAIENLKNLQKYKLLILDPIVLFESVNDGKPMEDSKIAEETRAMQFSILDILQKNMAAKNLRAKSIEETTNISNKQICESLKPHYKSLISTFRSKDSSLPILNKLRDESGFDALIISKTLVKVGSYGGILPLVNSSKVWGSTHSFETKVVALSLTDGKHIWSNEVYVSSMPYKEKLSEAFSMMFNTDNTEVSNNGL